MNHRKRMAITPPIGGEVRLGEEWPQHEVPLCKFHQLPQALVMEIFSRLNFKTLLNCRFVCKPWLLLISDPQCSHLCILRSPAPGILITTTPPKTKSRTLDYTWIEEHADSHWGIEKMRFTPKNSMPISDFKVINSCNGLLCLSGPGKYGPLYVCNPILGKYIALPPANNGRQSGMFVGLGFSAVTYEYKVLQTFYPECESPSPDNYYETQIYTIGTGVWRSIENAPWDSVCLSFNTFPHGALHWVSESTRYSEFIRSFSFEREQFQTLPAPSCFAKWEKEFADCLKLGVIGDCLFICVYGDDPRQFDKWVMKEYGVQDSWTKTIVVENLYLSERSCDLYEPLIFLSNGEILMSYNDWIVVCYDPNRKNLRETRIARTQSDFCAYAYSPSFVSLYFTSKGDEVKRVGTAKKLLNKRLAEGGSDCAGSSMPPHKSTKQNSSSSIPLRI